MAAGFIFDDTDFRDALRRLGNDARQELGRALAVEAELIMTDSKANYVPVDTGALRASGYVQAPVITRDAVSVTMGYGGAAAPYALPVHEDLLAVHPTGQAKYLEVPVHQRARYLGDRLTAALHAAVSRMRR